MAGWKNGKLDKIIIIKKINNCGEVSEATVQSWHERLPEILSGFTEPNNIWNIGCFEKLCVG